MSKLVLTKDPSHKGYYTDADGNLYVFRFGGRPIKVDDYREDKPNEDFSNKTVEVEKSKVIDHRKSASVDENDKFIKELETELTKKSHELSNTAKGAKFNKIEKELDELRQEKKNTIKRLEDTKKEFIVYKDIPDKPLTAEERKNRAQEELSRIREHDPEYNDNTKMSAREFIKKQTGQREMYQSIAKLMNDNEDKLSSEEWKALDNARMILKQNPELIADDSVLSDTSKPIHERLSKYMNDNEYKLDSGVWGPLYEANKVLRQNDSGEKTKLLDRYKQSIGVSDDWFTEEARKLKMSDEEIANAIYERKGAEAQGSTDDNIKRIIAGKEKDKWQKQLDKYEKMIDDPNVGEWDKQFAKSELQGVKNKIEEYANWEAEFIKRINRDDEVFTVKYSDGEFTENFKAVGLDEAFAMQDEWNRYGDTKIYDMDGNEIKYDMNRKHYTSPTYEENKIKTMRNNYKSRLYGADRSTLVSMVHNLGLNWNVERFIDAQLYRMLEKELNKK